MTKKTSFIYMGDPQCSRLKGSRKNDYSLWGKLLRQAEKQLLKQKHPVSKIKIEYLSDQQPEQKSEIIYQEAIKHDSEKLLMLGGDIVNHSNRPEEWTAFFEEFDKFREEQNILATRENGTIENKDTNKEGDSRYILAMRVNETIQNKDKKKSGDRQYILATPVNGAVESIGKYRERFTNTGNGPCGYEENFFSFDYGCCHFMILDSDYMGNRDKKLCSLFRQWIEDDIMNSSQPVVFAVTHHPFFTVGNSFEDDIRARGMCDNYLELLEKCGVDFILCGHQHVYARGRAYNNQGFNEHRHQHVCTQSQVNESQMFHSHVHQHARTQSRDLYTQGRETKSSSLVQLMGVSGGKHFKTNDASDVDFFKEFTSVATVFETDGDTISLKTVDEDGKIIDTFEKPVREKPDRKLSVLVQAVHEQPVRQHVLLSEIDFNKLKKHTVTYSVMWQGRLNYECKCGYLLSDVFSQAGILPNMAGDNKEDLTEESKSEYALVPTHSRLHTGSWEKAESEYVLVLTDKRGKQKYLKLYDVINAFRFEIVPEDSSEVSSEADLKRNSEVSWKVDNKDNAEADLKDNAEAVSKGNVGIDSKKNLQKNSDNEKVIKKEKVPAIIFKENDGFRLAFGQIKHDQYNGRGWAGNIYELEIIEVGIC